MNESAIWELAAEGGMAALTVERLEEKTSGNPQDLLSLYPEPFFMVVCLMDGIHQQALEQKSDDSLSSHDRLTDQVMTHLDAALPHRHTIARLWDDLVLMPVTLLSLRPYLVRIVRRILKDGGIKNDDAWEVLRTPAYVTLFLYVFYTWLYDKSPHQEHTLTTLDKGLRKLEKLSW
jgi:hypothetical protein